jgi:hypothetical protein
MGLPFTEYGPLLNRVRIWCTDLARSSIDDRDGYGSLSVGYDLALFFTNGHDDDTASSASSSTGSVM